MLKRESHTVRKYPRPKMTGEDNEGTENGHDKLEEKSSSQEKEDTKAANSQGKSKGGSDRSDPVDNYSDKNGNVHLSFPERMMGMLSDERNSNVVCWLPHGKGFAILDKKRFSNEVLPKFFSRKAKYTSFTRKLNRWSFTRVTRGPENGAYYHPLFQKGNLQLCTRMSCIDSKAPQASQPMSPVALGLTASPFAQMHIMMVDPNNLNLFPQESYASQSLSREWNILPSSFPTGEPQTMYANELHSFLGTPGDSTDEFCCARADGEPVRADEHDDGRSE